MASYVVMRFSEDGPGLANAELADEYSYGAPTMICLQIMEEHRYLDKISNPWYASNYTKWRGLINSETTKRYYNMKCNAIGMRVSRHSIIGHDATSAYNITLPMMSKHKSTY